MVHLFKPYLRLLTLLECPCIIKLTFFILLIVLLLKLLYYYLKSQLNDRGTFNIYHKYNVIILFIKIFKLNLYCVYVFIYQIII